jgi:GNAT superfamily N-acetyltransferase
VTDTLSDYTRPVLIQAIEQNAFESARLLVSAWPSGEVHDDPDLLWTITDIPYPLFNAVLRARLEPQDVDVAIEAAKARCAARGVPMGWRVGPTSQPANLGRSLIAHGFVPQGDAPGMAVHLRGLDLTRAALPGLSIERVRDESTTGLWGGIVADVFGMPDFVLEATLGIMRALGYGQDLPMSYYLGRWHGTAVAASSILLAAGVAGIYNVSTMPEARRRGIGAAMTVAPLLAARERGYRIGVLHSSPLGYNMYRSLGFEERCRAAHYLWMGPARRHHSVG